MLSVRLAHDLQLPNDQVSDGFYVALLRYLGFTADASEVGEVEVVRLAPTFVPRPLRLLTKLVRGITIKSWRLPAYG